MRTLGYNDGVVLEEPMIAIENRASQQKRMLPPLQNGDHLDQKTFHERYEAMPGVHAELIGGIVFMSSPQKSPHGRYHFTFNHWLGEYEKATLGTEGMVYATSILATDSEPQPDACLLILPEYGGQTW